MASLNCPRPNGKNNIVVNKKPNDQNYAIKDKHEIPLNKVIFTKKCDVFVLEVWSMYVRVYIENKQNVRVRSLNTNNWL